MRQIRILTALVLCLTLVTAAALADTTVTMTFAGDCTIGNEERLTRKDYSFTAIAARQGYGYFFSQMLPLFSQDDLTVVNFEGVLKEDDDQRVQKPLCFRGLPQFAGILPLGSVEAVNLSNNHAGDYGVKGRNSTMAALAQAGVGMFNDTTAYLYHKGNVTIAFVGFVGTGFFTRKQAYFKLIADLRAAGANAVVCTMHFGKEYASVHNQQQENMARAMIDAGADLVIGHHPHVLQGMEVYQNRNIFYSLGNFVFGGNAEVRALQCLVTQVKLTFDDQGVYLGQQARVYPAHISGDAQNNDYQPRLVTGEDALAVFATLDKDSAGQRGPTEQTDAYRDYAFWPAAVAPAEGETGGK